MSPLVSPAKFTLLGIPTAVFSLLIPVVGVAAFAYIMARRLAPLVKAAPDNRMGGIGARILEYGGTEGTAPVTLGKVNEQIKSYREDAQKVMDKGFKLDRRPVGGH